MFLLQHCSRLSDFISAGREWREGEGGGRWSMFDTQRFTTMEREGFLLVNVIK